MMWQFSGLMRQSALFAGAIQPQNSHWMEKVFMRIELQNSAFL